jgi:hypothetical protein
MNITTREASTFTSFYKVLWRQRVGALKHISVPKGVAIGCDIILKFMTVVA